MRDDTDPDGEGRAGDATGELEPVEPDGVPAPGTPSELNEHVDVADLDVREHPGLLPDESRRGGAAMVVFQGVLGVLVILAVATDSYAFTAIEELVGFGLIAFGLIEGWAFVRTRVRTWHYLQPIIAVVAGVVLIVWPRQTIVVAALALAAVIAVRGAQDVWAGVRRWHEPGANAWVFIRGSSLLVVAAIVLLFPGQSVVLVVVGGAALAVARAVVTLWFVAAHRNEHGTVDPSDTFGIVSSWLSQREMDAAAAEQVEDRVFLHHGVRRERLTRFAVLMGLATTIATFGIATDSTAVVIGAMLVAPLMTPILGVAAGLINGRTGSALISGGIVAAGALGTVGLAWLLSALIPDLEAVVQNVQVTTRTAPSLLDLGIALAAGAAGAYGVSRAESTDALPGVAVAIALVPPLAVVGVTLHAGDLSQVTGATLLFLTNLFSIILMAGLVFVLVGYGSWGRLYLRRNRIRVSFAAVTFAILLISIPLALTARGVISESQDLRVASAAVTQWLGEDTALRIQSIDVADNTVTVQLIGPTEPPTAQSLANELTARTGHRIAAIIRWVEESQQSSFLPPEE